MDFRNTEYEIYSNCLIGDIMDDGISVNRYFFRGSFKILILLALQMY